MTPGSPLQPLGRFLVITGVVILVVGLLVIALDRSGFLGRLPGDFVFRGKRWTLWVPLASSLILSIILTILLNLFRR